MVPRRCTLYWENLKRADDGGNNVKAGIMQGCDVGNGRGEEEGRNLHFSRCQRKTRGHFWFREMPQTRQRRELMAILVDETLFSGGREFLVGGLCARVLD